MLKSHAKYQNLKFQFSRVVEDFKLNVSLKKSKNWMKNEKLPPLRVEFFGGFVQLSKSVRKKIMWAGEC